MLTQRAIQALFLLLCMTGRNAPAQVTVEATFVQTAGCNFAAATPGVLGLSSDWQSMSTDNSGGQRASVLVTNVGSAIFAVGAYGFSWTRNGGQPGTAISTLLNIKDSATAGNTVVGMSTGVYSLTYSNSGSRTLYLQAQGTSSSAFYNAGTYKVSVPISCL